MPIAGISITSVNIRKSGNFVGAYQMNCNTTIKEIREQEVPQIKKKGLAMPLEFSAAYSGEDGKPFAEILISGDVLFLDEKNEQVLKEWKGEKKIPESMTVQIMGVIMKDVLTRTIQLTDFLQLPIPLPLPAITVETKQEKKK